MAEEKSTQKGASDPLTKPGTEQLNEGKEPTVNVSAEESAHEDNTTERNDNDAEDGEASEQGEEEGGSPSDPPMNGSNNKKQQQKDRADTASNQTRLQIIRAAKEASWNGKESKGTQLVWGSVSNRTNGANDAGWGRVGDKSIRVRNPSTKFLALPIGYPAMLDMGKIWKGYGGGAITEKALVIPPIAKLDMLKIEAARTKAHCLDFDNEKIFEENFTHCYYGSSEQNEMRGKIIYDQDSEKLGIMVMEKASGGNWVTAGKIPIKEENILTRGKLRLGTTVSFTTQIRDKTVFAHKISPCALLDPNGREHNTYTQLPNSISSILDPTYVSMLKTPAGKRLEDDRAELLVASLEKDYIKKLGVERWNRLDPGMCHTVDILVSDNDHSESDNYLGAAVINFTELIIKFQNGRQRQQSPFCWDVMKNLLSEDEVGLLEKKFEETKIGMTMVVEVDESHQKLALLWDNIPLRELSTTGAEPPPMWTRLRSPTALVPTLTVIISGRF